MCCLTRPCTRTRTHTYYPYRLIPSLASNVLYQFALVLEIKTLTETILRPQKEGDARDAQGGHVACATEM
jgi:hypothetical protein